MFLALLAFIAALTIVMLLIGLFARIKKRNVLIAIPVTLVGIPVILIGMLFLLKEPIQQGKILAGTSFGPLLNILSPPADLYHPLAFIVLDPEISDYSLNFSHKYLGNHALMVASPRPLKEISPSYAGISVSLTVFDGQVEMLKMESGKVGQAGGARITGPFWCLIKCRKIYLFPEPLQLKSEFRET